MASMNPSPMPNTTFSAGYGAGWNHPACDDDGGKALDDGLGHMAFRALLFSQNTNHKPGTEKMMLLQNCDLPPPNKVFPGPENEKLELFKALRLSQGRAREAENRYAAVADERDSLTRILWGDSMRAFGYRQLVCLLQLQVSSLHAGATRKPLVGCDCGCRGGGAGEAVATDGGDNGGSTDGGGGLTWVMAVAFCLGLAGFGVALGCKLSF